MAMGNLKPYPIELARSALFFDAKIDWLDFPVIQRSCHRKNDFSLLLDFQTLVSFDYSKVLWIVRK